MTPPVPLPALLADRLAGRRWVRVEEGESGGAIHRLEADGAAALYLKSGTGRVATDIADEAVRLAWLAPHLPVAALHAFVLEADGAWLLTGAVPGRTGDAWLEAEPGAARRITVAYAQFLRRLHALPVETCPFTSGIAQRLGAARANLEAGRVDMDDVEDEHRGWTPERLWDKLVGLLPDSVDPVVTHGDYSLGNLLLDEAGTATGCIDLGRLGIADRYADIAILWQNLTELGDGLPELFLAEYGIEAVDRRRLDFYRCLDEFF